MNRASLALLLCFSLPHVAAQTLVDRARRDEITLVGKDDLAMNQAIARAQSSLDVFLQDALARAPRNSGHAVKVRVADKRHTEFFWVVDLQRLGTAFRGRLDNAPRLVKHVRAGQHIGFKRSDIIDWLYVDPSGQMHGSFTTCVLLKKEKPEEAKALAAQLRLRCE
jgi:uncharacterized protein YegJ (DUF2314 family)